MFAPDALFPLGGYPGTEDEARAIFPKLDQAKVREDFIAAAGWLKARPECTGKYGAVGFCYGGGIVNMLATQLPDLSAAVPFYGSAHNVVPKKTAAEWVENVLDEEWDYSDNAPLAATLLARMSGDRERDLDADLRDRVAFKLVAHAAPETWVAMVREVTRLEAADERKIFGESLPPGLSLVE